MRFVSLSSVLTLVFLIYIGNTLWSLKQMFTAPVCSRGERCLSSYLSGRPTQHLVLYTSVSERPDPGRVTKVHTILNFDYSSPQQFYLELSIPTATRKNGTLHLHVAMLDENKLHRGFDELRGEPLHTIPLVSYVELQAAAFNLLNQKEDSQLEQNKKKSREVAVRPTAHINTHIEFSILADDLQIPIRRTPDELYNYIRISNNKFLPIIQHNILKSRLKNLKSVDKTTRSVNMTVSYSPISFGLLRLMVQVRLTLHHLRTMGFGEKDLDDVKGIFADTNLYLLSATVVIAACHLLFDFLAFKNDVSFWRRKKSMAGLSTRTVLWRAFSQCVILLYLLDENTSLIVLIPMSISALIELWKVKKVLRVQVSWRPPRLWLGSQDSRAEQHTRAVDAEAMRYLSYLLYPLCVAGAVYSLLYEPHKSWYSWSLHSLTNGVYAFGFLLMLPQLFINYRLRSVAALPWRAFMYKAFNTFIDDIFAFIITMPTAHRVACFRDDIVFLIYLYQRWLYPVDKSRTDDAVSMDEAAVETVKSKED